MTSDADACRMIGGKGIMAHTLEARFLGAPVIKKDGQEVFFPYNKVNALVYYILVKGTVMRERVCIMEIWVECFGKERQNLKKADSYEIEGILNKIGGWKKYDSNTTGKTKVPLYGVQKTFVRMDEKPEETR